MKTLNKLFPPLLLLLTCCSTLFKHKTNATAVFNLEISSNDILAEKVKKILSNRLIHAGFYDEDIKIENNENKLEITIKNYDSTEIPLSDLRKILTTQGELEFWETFENEEIISKLVNADTCLAAIFASSGKMKTDSSSDSANKDTVSVTERLLSADESEIKKAQINHPLFSILAPSINQSGSAMPGPIVGIALLKDTGKIMSYLNNEKIVRLLPDNLKFVWTNKVPPGYQEDAAVRGLVALKITRRDKKAALYGDIIADARKENGQGGGIPYISISMKDEAAQTWAMLTEENIGKSIAIVLDGYAFSYPTVQGKISGGKSTITGNFTAQEADDLVNILKSGLMPGSVKIINEQIIRSEN